MSYHQGIVKKAFQNATKSFPSKRDIDTRITRRAKSDVIETATWKSSGERRLVKKQDVQKNERRMSKKWLKQNLPKNIAFAKKRETLPVGSGRIVTCLSCDSPRVESKMAGAKYIHRTCRKCGVTWEESLAEACRLAFIPNPSAT